MTRYIIREQIFTLRNKFTIKDDRGRAHYKVTGRFFSLGKKLRIDNMHGEEEVFIKQKIFRIFPQYNIYDGRDRLAKVKKRFSFFRPRFSINSSYGDFEVEGNILKYNFNILKDKRLVGVVSKRWVSLSDTYTVDIKDGEDHPLILAVVIILDQIFHDNTSTSNNNQNMENNNM